jgi:hypothetical protein
MHAHGSSKQLQERQQAAAKGKIKALASQVDNFCFSKIPVTKSFRNLDSFLCASDFFKCATRRAARS